MGWKLSSIIINHAATVKFEDLLDKLGFKNLTKLQDESFDSAMHADKDKVFIGNYKDNLMICAANLPLQFFDHSLSEIEKLLIESFPNSEICAVSLQSTINHFGFALIKNGKKIRVKAGDAERGTTVDFGQPLEQEKDLLSKSKVNENGQRLYYLSDDRDEVYLENQVGENFIFEIFKRYTGKPLDQDDKLLDTSFACYKFTSDPLSFDQFFSGEWQGEYCFGEGYRDLVKGKKEAFTLNISLINGEVKGICMDENKVSDHPANIEGFLIGVFIGFLKRYPFRYFLDDKGVTQKETSKQPENVVYSGLYDSLTDGFKGVWRIENKKLWGEWTMKRKRI